MNPNFILIILGLVLGGLLRVTGRIPKNAHQSFNAFVIWVSLPSVVLVQIPLLLKNTSITPELLVPVSMSWLLFGLSFLTFYSIGKKLRWSKPETGALIMTAGLGNTSFVGFPLLESMFGQAGVQIGVLVDQPGTFLTLSTLGLVVASVFSPTEGRTIHVSSIAKKIMTFPPFIALLVALAWHCTGTYGPSPFLTVLERFGATLVPLAMVGVGYQLKISAAVMKRQWKPLLMGLSFKLILAPMFFLALYVFAFSSHGLTARVTVLESAMAPMITAAIVAEEFELNAEIANLMVGVGIPLSIATVLIWNQVLSVFF